MHWHEYLEAAHNRTALPSTDLAGVTDRLGQKSLYPRSSRCGSKVFDFGQVFEVVKLLMIDVKKAIISLSWNFELCTTVNTLCCIRLISLLESGVKVSRDWNVEKKSAKFDSIGHEKSRKNRSSWIVRFGKFHLTCTFKESWCPNPIRKVFVAR